MSFNLDNIEFKNEKQYLSNMYFCKIVIDGITYSSSENYYMSMKFITTDKQLAKQIESCTPKEAKKLSRLNVKLIRTDWDDIKLEVMLVALLAKFSQHTELLSKLIATGDEHIEERNDWNDTYWGTCKGIGSNYLGKLLMKVRNLFNEKDHI